MLKWQKCFFINYYKVKILLMLIILINIVVEFLVSEKMLENI